MKNRAIIHMGASRWDVTIKGPDGEPVVFDLYHMDKDQRRTFHRAFIKAFREGMR